MNRIFTLILVIALLVVAIATTSCQKHEHNFKSTVVAATCVTQGYTEHVCQDPECGYTMRDTITAINPKNHKQLTVISVTDPSCEMGYTTNHCEGCQKEVLTNYKNPVHTFGEWTLVSVICSNGGIYERVCTNDECGYREEKLAEADHTTENEVYVPATELTSDCIKHYCDCGKNYYFDTYGEPLSAQYLEFELCKDGDKTYYMVVGLKEGADVTEIYVPYEVGNIPVTTIDYRAFLGNDKLTAITFTENLTNIRATAFELCSNITVVNFTGTIDQWNKIEKGAEWATFFENACLNLEDGHYDFEANVVAPTELKSGYTEHYCSCRETYYRDTYVAPNGSDALVFELSEDESYYRVVGFNAAKIGKNVVIPFDYMGIPVKEIYFNAFFECDAIQTVTITKNVQWIRSTAFTYCKNLTKVIFVGTEDQWKAIEKGYQSGVEGLAFELYVEKK